MKPSQRHYFESLAFELEAQEARVRSLIGSKHWLTDGHHKEALLRGLLERHCPHATIVAQGFIISDDGGRLCSKEQDIMVLDTHSEMPLFSYNGTVVTTSRKLLASIQVKSVVSNEQFDKSFKCLASLPELPFTTTHPWLGVFFYQLSEPVQLKNIATKVLALATNAAADASLPRSGTMRLGPDVLATWAIDEQKKTIRVSAHDCAGMSTAHFLARLLDTVARKRDDTSTAFGDALDETSGSLATELVEGPMTGQ